MIFEIRLRTLEVRLSHLLISVAFPGTFLGITTTHDCPVCNLCHTVEIYSQLHVLRTFRTALNCYWQKLISLGEFGFFPAQVVNTTPVIWNCSWEQYFPDQPAKSTISLILTDVVSFF